MQLPWNKVAETDPHRQYVAMASRLPLARYPSVASFLRATMLIRRQLARADGLVGYTLDAQLFRKTFWTLSVWESQEAIRQFSRTDPHHGRVERIRPRMQPTTFVFWTVSGSGVPIRWNEARHRLTDQATEDPSWRAAPHQ